MKKNNKKKIVKRSIVVGLSILTLGSIFYFNKKDVKALKHCNAIKEMYADLALKVDPTTGQVLDVNYNNNDNNYYTYFEGLPRGAQNISIGGETHAMTEQDCHNYVDAIEHREEEGLGTDEAYCDSSIDGRTHCINSGAGTGWLDIDTITNHGETCDQFVNSSIDTETHFSYTGEVDENGNPQIYIERPDLLVTQDMMQNAYEDADGNKWVFVTKLLEISASWDAETCEDDPNGDGSGDGANSCLDPMQLSASLSGCEAGGAGQSTGLLLVTEWYGSSHEFPEEIHDQEYCGGQLSEQATAQGNAHQNGSFRAGNFRNIWAGGGIDITFSYNTTAVWNYCGDYAEHGVFCARKWLKPECPADYSLQLPGQPCVKKETTIEYRPEQQCHRLADGTWGCEMVDVPVENTVYYYADYSCPEKGSGGGWQDANGCGSGGGPAEQHIAQRAGDYTQDVSVPSSSTKNSNAYPAQNDSLEGSGAGSFDGGGGHTGSWYPGTQISGSISYQKNESCINLYAPFNVTYGRACNSEELNGRKRYFVPLKWPKEDPFPIEISGGQGSVVNLMNWSFGLSCQVSVDQRIYEDPKHNNFSYKFIYRPINLSDPFPNRNAGRNWTYFMNSEEAKETELTRDRLEYHAFFTKSDISNLKASLTSNRKYSDLRTIQTTGYSNELASMISSGYNIERVNAHYDALGKCTGRWCILQ